MKRGALAAAALIVLGLVGAAAAYVLVKRHQARDIRGSSTVEFATTEEAVPTIPSELREVQWPMYGFDGRRARAVQGLALRPPFRRKWVAGGASLLEFPPVIGYGRLFYVNNHGTVYAVGAKTGKVAWRRRTGRCAAASPALDEGTVFVALLNTRPCNAERVRTGEVIAFSTGFGQIRWRTTIGPSESSPLVANGLVFVGDWKNRLLALDEETGKIRWTFRAGGRVKSGVALAGGTLYFGAYDNHVYAVAARTGKLRWKAKGQPRLGHSGRFYSTPAVAYGRVYVGSTDGKLYSFGASSGKLRWSHSTGGYVYASPAVWKRRVFVGSYSKRFYALDAATGDVLWTFTANGKISGSPTVLDNVVYFATLSGRTYGLNAATGRQVWTFPDGKYSPVVADRDHLYLVGYAKVYGMVAKR